ncbi:hypothetical protein C8J56DRAFT_893529 [Mycena floridula]|nr:hypothetical protein C8J56DRAFT_893529 [Mycena floridula]
MKLWSEELMEQLDGRHQNKIALRHEPKATPTRTRTYLRILSQATIPQYAQNVKEEVGNVAGDLAKAVAGSKRQGEGGFKEITKGIASQVPQPAMVLGLAGTIPYVGTVYLARNASLVSRPWCRVDYFGQALNLRVTYGAFILSFLVCCIWKTNGSTEIDAGAAPLFLAYEFFFIQIWPTLTLQPVIALVVQWFANFLSILANPTPFSDSDFLLGLYLGVSYGGPVAGHGFVSHDLQEIKEERKNVTSQLEKTSKGSVETSQDPQAGYRGRERGREESAGGGSREERSSDSEQ